MIAGRPWPKWLPAMTPTCAMSRIVFVSHGACAAATPQGSAARPRAPLPRRARRRASWKTLRKQPGRNSMRGPAAPRRAPRGATPCHWVPAQATLAPAPTPARCSRRMLNVRWPAVPDGSGAGSWLASGLQLCAGPCASSRQVTAVARLPALRARAPGPPMRLGCEKRRTVLLHALTLSSLETSAVLLLVVSVSLLVSPKKPY